MNHKIYSDRELTLAASIVRHSMLSALPEPKDCHGEFSSTFEEKMLLLQQREEKYKARRQSVKRVLAAIFALFIGISLLLATNTKVRASVVAWIKETFERFTSYYFEEPQNDTLPEYKLTWIPEGYNMVFEDKVSHAHTMVFQRGENPKDSFTLDYCFVQSESSLSVHTFDDHYDVKTVSINECSGELYLSHDASKSHGLIWYDEETGVVFTITAFLQPEDILHIAEGLKLGNV